MSESQVPAGGETHSEHVHDESVPHTHDPVTGEAIPVAASSSKKSKKGLFIALGAVLVVVVLLTGLVAAAFALHGKKSPLSFIPVEALQNPNDSVNQAFNSQIDSNIASIDKTNNASSKDLSAVFNSLTTDYKGGSYKMTLAVTTSDSTVNFNGTVTLDLDTATKRTGTNIKFDLKASQNGVSVDIKGVEGNIVYADGVVYLEVVSFPDDIAALIKQQTGQDIVAQYKGKWLKLDFKQLASQYGLDLTKSTEGTTSALSVDDYKALLNEAKKYTFFKDSKLIGRETVNGVNTIHYTTNVDLDQIEKFTKYYAGVLKSKDPSFSYTDDEIASGFKSMRDNVTINGMDLYLNVDDNSYQKVAFDLTTKPQSGSTMTVNVKAGFEVVKNNQAQTINVPTDATDLIDIVNSYLTSYYSAPAATTTVSDPTTFDSMGQFN